MTNIYPNNQLIAKILQEVSILRFNEAKNLSGAIKSRTTQSALAHQRASKAILNLNYEITQSNQKQKIPGIGKGISDKIREILETGTLEILENITIEEKEKRETIKNFKRIWGAGEGTATEWYNLGYRKLENLPLLLLTEQQRLGLTYLNDLEIPIPRKEIKELGKLINEDLEHLVGGDYKGVVVGSYRRGKLESKDIDILIYPTKKGLDESDILRWVIQERFPDIKVLSFGSTRFTGLVWSKSSSKWRHLDIWVSKLEEIPFALLAYTGPANTNIDLRKVAIKKGWKLNEKGLFDGGGKFIPAKSEEDIYSILEVPYSEPENRK